MPPERPSGRQLVALKNQIVKSFSDSHWLELGMLTDTFDMVNGHSRLLRSLSWNDPDYEGNALEMIKNIIDADPNNYALLLDFVARTCPEEGKFVSSSDDGGRRIVFSPNVFKVPGEKPDINLVSVMMPFSGSL
jgi:hypothetical protein